MEVLGDFDASSASSVEFQGALTIPEGNYPQLNFNDVAVKTMAGVYDVAGITSSSPVSFGASTTLNGEGEYRFTDVTTDKSALGTDGVVYIDGVWTNEGNSSFSTGEVTLSGTALQQIPKGVTFKNLILSGGVKEFLDEPEFATGYSFDPSACSEVIFGGNSIYEIPQLTYNKVTLQGDAKEMKGTYTVAELTNNSVLQFEDDTYLKGAGVTNFNAEVVLKASRSLSIEGDLNVSALGVITAGRDSKLIFSGTQTQVLNAALNIPCMEMAGTNLTFFQNTTIEDELVFSSGTMDISQGLTVNGDVIVNGGASITGTSSSNPFVLGGSTQNQDITSNGFVWDYLRVNKTGGNLNPQDELQISKELQIVGSGTVVSGGNVTLIATASSQAIIPEITGGGSITGNVNVQVHYPFSEGFWTHIAMPVDGNSYQAMHDKGFTVWTDGAVPSIYTYEEGNDWVPIDASDRGVSQSAGHAFNAWVYEQFLLDGGTLEHTGNVVGDFSLPLQRTADGNAPGFNLVGNPYPAPLSALALANGITNSNGVVQIFDSRNDRYEVINVGEDANIAVGQAFFIELTSGTSGAINFTESMKANANDASIMKVKNDLQALATFKIESASGKMDKAYFRFANAGVDPVHYKATKNFGSSLNLAFVQDSLKYVVQVDEELEEEVEKEYPLWISYGSESAGQFTLKLDYELSFPGELQLWDKFTEEFISFEKLKEGYAFALTEEEGSAAADRFALRIYREKVVTDNQLPLDLVKVFPNPVTDGALKIELKTSEEVSIMVVDATGQKVDGFTLNSSGIIKNRSWLNKAGLYIIRSKVGSQIYSHKILVR
ncbi:T9SS type A sorting domain-containing protein [Persicobacter diffluens]|uniref:Secretion system C-terminal sorting domain-containing protein n=1 Tax=Persicobacter diffluens TaxID=981 RepID=A0AAN4VYY8_9BACT|nr:hypothetical protein PEDI_20700 [Persicobacter diffluens]